MSGERDPEREAARRRAIIDAEVQDIVRALAPYGVLDRDVLAERCRASTWQDGGFDEALEAAVAAGRVEQLPDGFYGLVR
ncbi:MAG TPA: hypothetical protein VGL69_21410 [Solirubrobacteraceae bacterium]|jgi:hypothetical protein